MSSGLIDLHTSALPSISLADGRFVDALGRETILRGVNLGGDSKVPFPDGWSADALDSSRPISFVGRPFPLAAADEHLARIKRWGFNCLRLLTTWEAVAHAGPDEFDESYLDYFAEVCRRAERHGLYVFVDFHQDVWSRHTGGDGAPAWTLEAIGIDPSKLADADSAHLMQAKYDYQRGGYQEDYAQFSWVRNYTYAPNAIMWTLFFAGRAMAPRFMIDGRNAQDWLQDGYLAATAQVAARLAAITNVIGFGNLNEPSLGWIGRPLSYRHLGPSEVDPDRTWPGPAWSALDALAAAAGLTRTLPVLERDAGTGETRVSGETVVNPAGISIWRPGWRDPFEAEGIWRRDGGCAEALREDAFMRIGERPIDVSRDAYAPFFRRVAETIRAFRPDWLLFAAMDPPSVRAGRRFPAEMPRQWVNASHWYDYTLALSKTFDFSLDPAELRSRFTRDLRDRIALAPKGVPALVGEFGICADLDEGAAYTAFRAGDRTQEPWRAHARAFELMYEVFDELRLSSTQWNYSASNRNETAIGDGWNLEDFSIYSQDQTDPEHPETSGARGALGFIRPYAKSVQGKLIRQRYDRASGVFEVEIYADPAVAGDTRLFAPWIQLSRRPRIAVIGAAVTWQFDDDLQEITVRAEARGRVTVTVERAREP